jgi:hypothetical protein
LTEIKYPDESSVTYDYGETDSAGDSLSRPEAINQDDDPIVSYGYLGLRTPVAVVLNGADNLQLTYVNGLYEPAGDQYSGLDRFGRVVETIWKHDSDKVVHSKYGYTRFSAMEWRRDEAAHTAKRHKPGQLLHLRWALSSGKPPAREPCRVTSVTRRAEPAAG